MFFKFNHAFFCFYCGLAFRQCQAGVCGNRLFDSMFCSKILFTRASVAFSSTPVLVLLQFSQASLLWRADEQGLTPAAADSSGCFIGPFYWCRRNKVCCEHFVIHRLTVCRELWVLLKGSVTSCEVLHYSITFS